MSATTSRRKKTPIPLPFVTENSWWHVKSTGDFGRDQQLGSDYAIQWLRWEVAEAARQDTHPALLHILSAMKNYDDGIESGFIHMVGFAARDGLAAAERLQAYWKSKMR